MSLSRAANPLRKWPRGGSARILSPPRQFHAFAPSLAAKRSPIARDKQRRSVMGDRASDGMINSSIAGPRSRERLMERIPEWGEGLLLLGTHSGILPPKLTKETFIDVGIKLVDAAWNDKPDPRIIGRISSDPEVVYLIGLMFRNLGPRLFYEWVIAACARAGSKTAILTAAARELNKEHPSPNFDRSILSDIRHLAMREQDPRAMILHAMDLYAQERFADARNLLYAVFDHIEPAKPTLQAPLASSAILRGEIPVPWELFRRVSERMNIRDEKSDRVRNIAAYMYGDPISTSELAYTFLPEDKSQRNAVKYEEYMTKAASAGNAQACANLASYFYLQYLGLDPVTLDRLDVDGTVIAPAADEDNVMAAEMRAQEALPKPMTFPLPTSFDRDSLRTTLATYRDILSTHIPSRETCLAVAKSLTQKFNLETLGHLRTTLSRYRDIIVTGNTRPRSDYLALASCWYLLAVGHGDTMSAILLARIHRVHGDDISAFEMLDDAERSGEYPKRVQKLRDAWMEGLRHPRMKDEWYSV